MMRLVIGRLLSLIERYPPLVDGAFVIIVWVGFKLLHRVPRTGKGYVHFEIPKWISLGLIVVIFVASFLYARVRGARVTPRPTTQHANSSQWISGRQSLPCSRRSARRCRLSGACGGVICARKIRSIRRISISSGVGAGVRSS